MWGLPTIDHGMILAITDQHGIIQTMTNPTEVIYDYN